MYAPRPVSNRASSTRLTAFPIHRPSLILSATLRRAERRDASPGDGAGGRRGSARPVPSKRQSDVMRPDGAQPQRGMRKRAAWSRDPLRPPAPSPASRPGENERHVGVLGHSAKLFQQIVGDRHALLEPLLLVRPLRIAG